MIVPGSVNPLLMAGGRETTPCGGSVSVPSYVIKNSLRFRSSAGGRLRRDPTSTGNGNVWSFSCWVKRANLTSENCIFSAGSNGDNQNTAYLAFLSGGGIHVQMINGGTILVDMRTTAVFRDPSAWYHIVLQADMPNAVAADRIRLYVNGVRITSFSTNTNVLSTSSSSVYNTPIFHSIGQNNYSAAGHPDFYLADVHSIDAYIAEASAFGEFDPVNAVWQPKAYTGPYGVNGFWLKFDDAAQIGKDSSGNNNHWTANNIDVAAPGTQATYDLMKDSPVMFDDGTANPPGNYCTWNVLDRRNSPNCSQGNLSADLTGTQDQFRGTISASGKIYWEVELNKTGGNHTASIGLIRTDAPISGEIGYVANSSTYQERGLIKLNGVDVTSSVPGLTNGDVIGIALDTVAGNIAYYRNGTLVATIGSGISGEWSPAVSSYNAAIATSFYLNAGQRPFKYPPAGFKALCTTNLPTPSITKGSDHFDIALGAGAGILAQAQALKAHDLIWIKDRANSNNHQLIDVVRGANALHTNDQSAESAYVAPSGNSVAWTWRAGGAPVANTDGSIASQVSVNKCSGFSISRFSPSGASTIGHGLGVAPQLIIMKYASAANTSWYVYHSSLGSGSYLVMNSVNAAASDGTIWNNTLPTASAFSIGSAWTVSGQMMAYCFAPIPGMSAFGSYQGTGNADGPFCYLGFKPKFLMVKITDGNSDWIILDASRPGYNLTDGGVYPNAPTVETPGSNGIDILSNGFKCRSINASTNNSSSNKYVYAAFAEHPFSIARAR